MSEHNGSVLDESTLDDFLARSADGRLPLGEFLPLAVDIATALGQLHGQGRVHKDVKPSNVRVDATGRVRLAGFDDASHARRERSPVAPPQVIAGTFAYMAPEQTGRMNRAVDARSDLYSLGVTFFELLTGTLPFTADEPMEWIHCHIARQPPAPSESVPTLPAVVDALVLKLLAKDPEDRYQTASGLALDLRRCLTHWDAQGRIPPFTLAASDVPDRLVVPDTLYGRDADIALLADAFERVRTRGAAGLVLVSGYSGIGKSSIVNELHATIAASHGLFAAGKFDQYKRDIPYATLAQALQGLVRQLLGKDDEELGRWREALLAALGPNGQLMVSLIPELELVIGQQAPVPALEPQDATARFQRVFRSLIGVFAQAAHPLVLFIDDLQWLDTGTLDLLTRLVTEPAGLHLLVIGAYRDNEVGPAHPLSRTLAAMRASEASISEMTLAPLSVADVERLCADALHTGVERVGALAALIAEKTGGNPFFAIQFLLELGDEGLLAFDPALAAWQWDVDRIRSKGITDNVADLMAAKLNRLPAVTRETLCQLACLGNATAIDVAALVLQSSEEALTTALRDATDAGLVFQSGRIVTFAHDRVHEAAYALVPAGERAATHLRVGRALASVTPPAELDDRIFEVANQFARGLPAIDSAAERDAVAARFLAAGRRAQASSAHASARTYFDAGGSLLDETTWTRCPRLALDLELNRAECEIVLGELDAAEARLTGLAPHVTAVEDQTQVVCLSVLLYFTTGRSARAVEVALQFLARMGIEWSTRPGEAEVRAEYIKMRRLLDDRPAGTLIDLPAMRDPDCIATMAVLTELFPAAYAVDRYLLELVLLRMTTLSLEYGHAESSSVAYSALNMALGSHFGDYATAYRFGRLACDLVDRHGIERYKARVYSCVAAFTMPWFEPLAQCRPLMTAAFEIGRSNGDMAFASYNSRNLMTHLLMAGAPLALVQREAEDAMAFARQLQLGLPAERFIEQLALVRKLRSVVSREDGSDDEWATGDVEAHPQLAMMVCYHWVFRLEERLLAGDIATALDASARVAPIRWAMRSSIEEAEYVFYTALAHAAWCDTASAADRDVHVRALTEHGRQIALWAEHCPATFANRAALIGAEIARVSGHDLEAERLYEDAVRLAREGGFVQNQAFACERAGLFHGTRGLETIAHAYLAGAQDCYERWGAVGKVRQLRARLPQRRPRDTAGVPSVTIDKPLAQFDVEVVDKASQTLSSEMALPTLLEKLVRLAVEHAGAEHGLLVLLRDGKPMIEAEAVTGSGGVEVALGRGPATPVDLPLSALQYVRRTRQRLILDDAAAGGLDRDDEYMQHRQPKSVLCCRSSGRRR